MSIAFGTIEVKNFQTKFPVLLLEKRFTMRIVRLQIERFRSIRIGILFPGKHNVFLGPNNIGKTAVLEALNLLLNPELTARGSVVDENDFYCREYRLPPQSTDQQSNVVSGADGIIGSTEPGPTVEAAPQVAEEEAVSPIIRIEAVITGLTDEDAAEFSSALVPWAPDLQQVVEMSDEGQDPFANAERAIRPCFEAWYDEEEDNFAWKSFFRTDLSLSRDLFPTFTKRHKRRIGFLVYRDFRALQRPITLEPFTLFSRLLSSQDATPKHFENVLGELEGAIQPLFQEPNFARIVSEYRQELLRYLPLANIGEGHLSFEATDRTREQVKAAAAIIRE
jgi:putative ATP-dependent endonuclease of OLD family